MSNKGSSCYSRGDLIRGIFQFENDGAHKISIGAWARAYFLRDGETAKAKEIEQEMESLIGRLAKEAVSNY